MCELTHSIAIKLIETNKQKINCAMACVANEIWFTGKSCGSNQPNLLFLRNHKNADKDATKTAESSEILQKQPWKEINLDSVIRWFINFF